MLPASARVLPGFGKTVVRGIETVVRETEIGGVASRRRWHGKPKAVARQTESGGVGRENRKLWRRKQSPAPGQAYTDAAQITVWGLPPVSYFRLTPVGTCCVPIASSSNFGSSSVLVPCFSNPRSLPSPCNSLLELPACAGCKLRVCT